MATYGDFSSLLQLGVGIGIGLSLFRAPVDLRTSKLMRTMDNELTVLRNPNNQFAKMKWRDVRELRYRFGQVRDDLDKVQLPFMWAAIVLAILNLAALVVATVDKERAADGLELYGLLFIAVGGFFIILAALEGMARWYLNPIRAELRKIQSRRAPPVAAPLAYGGP